MDDTSGTELRASLQTASLSQAIETFLEAEAHSFALSEKMDVAVSEGQKGEALVPLLSSAKNAAGEVCQRLEDVISIKCVDMNDMLKKLQVWAELTGCKSPSDESSSQIERLIASLYVDMEDLTRIST